MRHAFDQRPDEIKTHCRLARDQEALILTPGNWAKVNGIAEIVVGGNQDRMMEESAFTGPQGPSFRAAGETFIFNR